PSSHCNRVGFCASKARLHHSIARCRRRGGMTYRRLWLIVLAGFAASGLAVSPRHAGATLRFGPLQISGNAQTQNLVRTPDASTWEFIQNRNTAHILLNYDWVEGGKFITKYDLPFIEKSSATLLWRGVYDSIYSFTPGFLQKEDIHGRNYQGLNFFQYATQIGIPPTRTGNTHKNKLPHPRLNYQSFCHESPIKPRFDNELRDS